jgi:hypothetical protein
LQRSPVRAWRWIVAGAIAVTLPLQGQARELTRQY